MRITPGSTPDWSDDVSHALRSRYSAPNDSSYWSHLEQRIMDRVRAEAAREWWSHFPGWVRVGLAAAAAALIVASVATWQVRAAQDRVAYRELLDPSSEVPILSERDPSPRSSREQTLRYLLSR